MERRTEELLRCLLAGDASVTKDSIATVVATLNGKHQTSREGLLTVSETCRFLCISRTTLHRIVCDGELPCVRIRGRKMFDRRDLNRFIGMRRGG